MATRGEIKTAINLLLSDSNDQKWTDDQKNEAIAQAVRDSYPAFYDLVQLDGGTGFVTVSGTLEYTPTLTGITEEGVIRLEMAGASTSEPYTNVASWVAMNISGTETIRLDDNPPGGRKLRATYRKAKAVPTADEDTVDLPENFVGFWAAFVLATAYLPKGSSVDVQNYQKMAPVWQRMAESYRRSRGQLPPAVPVRRRRGV